MVVFWCLGQMTLMSTYGILRSVEKSLLVPSTFGFFVFEGERRGGESGKGERGKRKAKKEKLRTKRSKMRKSRRGKEGARRGVQSEEGEKEEGKDAVLVCADDVFLSYIFF